MRGTKSLTEWLESKGNPKHHIAYGENGSMVIAIEDNNSLTPGITLYSFNESNDSFWISSGWGVNREYLPALRGLLNNELAEDLPEPEIMEYNIMEWRDDEEGEYECVIDIAKALSETHARIILKNGINSAKYPKGAWIEYSLNGKRICLDSKGRIPATRTKFTNDIFDRYIKGKKLRALAKELGYENTADFGEDMYIWAVNHGEKAKVMQLYEMNEATYTEARELWADEMERE
jgi:hypothetical protein